MNAGTMTRMRKALASPLGQIAMLTLGLGATVAVSWLVVGGRLAAQGPMPTLETRSVPLFAFQSVLAAGVTALFVGLSGERAWRRIVGLVIGAWLGELVVLTVGGSVLVANELVPTVAWFYWLIGTGGPIQPIAAITGGLAAIRFSGPTTG
jgi:hypothetical protein